MLTLTSPDRKQYTEANRAAWNEVMPLHQRAAREKLDRLFARPGYSLLGATEVALLQQVGLQGKDVAHLCCNNGRELLSLKNLGAGECTGFDISDEAIAEATQRAATCGIDCRFVRTDVYDIDSSYNGCYDIAYMTTGCLGWMPDLRLLFAKAAALLRPGGLVFIHEMHPFFEMTPHVSAAQPGVLLINEPYFKAEPYADQGGLDYVGNAPYEAQTTQYWFVHTLSDIFMGLIGNGMAIEHFYEYDSAVSPHQRSVEEAKGGFPLSMIVIARKSSGPSQS